MTQSVVAQSEVTPRDFGNEIDALRLDMEDIKKKCALVMKMLRELLPMEQAHAELQKIPVESSISEVQFDTLKFHFTSDSSSCNDRSIPDAYDEQSVANLIVPCSALPRTQGVRQKVCETLNLFLPPEKLHEESVNALDKDNGIMEDEAMKFYDLAVEERPKVKMKVKGTMTDTAFDAGIDTCNKRPRDQQQPNEDGDVMVFPDEVVYGGQKEPDVEGLFEEVIVHGVGNKEEGIATCVLECTQESSDKRCGVCGLVLMEKLKEGIGTWDPGDQLSAFSFQDQYDSVDDPEADIQHVPLISEVDNDRGQSYFTYHPYLKYSTLYTSTKLSLGYICRTCTCLDCKNRRLAREAAAVGIVHGHLFVDDPLYVRKLCGILLILEKLRFVLEIWRSRFLYTPLTLLRTTDALIHDTLGGRAAACLCLHNLVDDRDIVLTFEGSIKRYQLKTIVRVHYPRFYWTIMTKDDLGLADAYINGGFSFVDKNEGIYSFCYDALHEVARAYATRIFLHELGATESSLLTCTPREDLGGGHPGPNLIYSKELVACMVLGSNAAEDSPEFGAAAEGDADQIMIHGKRFFVTPSEFVIAIIAANAVESIPYLSSGLKGVAWSMPPLVDLDVVANSLNLQFFEVPIGCKFFGNLKDAGICSASGEESFATGSDHILEKDGIWDVLAWLSILTHKNIDNLGGGKLVTVVPTFLQVVGSELIQNYLDDSFLADRLHRKEHAVLTAELVQGIKSGSFQIVEMLLCVFTGRWRKLGLVKYCVEVFGQISFLEFNQTTRPYNAVIDGMFYDPEDDIGEVEVKDGISNVQFNKINEEVLDRLSGIGTKPPKSIDTFSNARFELPTEPCTAGDEFTASLAPAASEHVQKLRKVKDLSKVNVPLAAPQSRRRIKSFVVRTEAGQSSVKHARGARLITNAVATKADGVTAPAAGSKQGHALLLFETLREDIEVDMERDLPVCIVDEDVGHCGGPYTVIKDLAPKYGDLGVLDTPIAENYSTGLRQIIEAMNMDFLFLAFKQISNQSMVVCFTSDPVVGLLFQSSFVDKVVLIGSLVLSTPSFLSLIYNLHAALWLSIVDP